MYVLSLVHNMKQLFYFALLYHADLSNGMAYTIINVIYIIINVIYIINYNC